MPLKRSYATEAEVPTEHKADYVLRGGRYVLDIEGVENVDGLLSKNTELLGKVSGHAAELSTKDAEINRLTGELTQARTAPTLQSGQRAVSKGDAELVEAVKAEGLDTIEKVKTLKTEHGNYKTTAEAATAAKHAEEVGTVMGWDKEKTARTATKVYDFSTLEVREADGKKTVVAKVKTAENQFVEKPFAEVVKSTAELSDLLPSLTANGSTGTRVPGSTGGGGSAAKNEFDEIRGEVTETRKTAQPKDNASVLAALNGQRPAATA